MKRSFRVTVIQQWSRVIQACSGASGYRLIIFTALFPNDRMQLDGQKIWLHDITYQEFQNIKIMWHHHSDVTKASLYCFWQFYEINSKL